MAAQKTEQLASNVRRVITKAPSADYSDMVLKEFFIENYDVEKKEKYLEYLDKEYTTMKNLKHVAQVVKVIAIKKYETAKHSCAAILMEYCGPSLYEDISRAKEFTFNDKLQIAIKLAQGLLALRKENYGHCDIKPHNITFYNGEVKIIDFGSATTTGDTVQFSKTTQNGNIISHTPNYAPPEVINQAPVARDKIDVYSFGKTCYQLFYQLKESDLSASFQKYAKEVPGRPQIYLVSNEDYTTLFLKNITPKKFSGDTSNGEFSNAITSLLIRCMAFHHQNRPTFEDILFELGAIQRGEVLLAHGNCYEPCDQAYFLRQFDEQFAIATSSLCYVSRRVATEVHAGSTMMAQWPIAALEDLAEYSSIYLPPHQIFTFGGSRDMEPCVKTIFGINVQTRVAKPHQAWLQEARLEPTLVTNGASIYILGGGQAKGVFLKSCEEFRPQAPSTKVLPKLHEAKKHMAACIYKAQDIYVFGGEINYDYEHPGANPFHNYSVIIEKFSPQHDADWSIIEMSNPESSHWRGCSMSGAYQDNDSIVILGGYLWNKQADQYEWSMSQIVFDVGQKKFGERKELFENVLELIRNPIYRLRENTFMVWPNHGNKEQPQFFYTYTEATKWRPHCFQA